MNRILKILCGVACAFVFCFLAIGYAAVQDELRVNGSVTIEKQEVEIVITCADTDAYVLDGTTGKLEIKETYIGTDNKTYRVIGIKENGFSSDSNEVGYDASTVRSVIIPKSVKTIGANAFTGCSNLKSFTVDAGNVDFIATDQVLFDSTGTNLLRYPPCNKYENTMLYKIPLTTTSITPYAFCNLPASTVIVTNKDWGTASPSWHGAESAFLVLESSENALYNAMQSATGDSTSGYTIACDSSIKKTNLVFINGNGTKKWVAVEENPQFTIPASICNSSGLSVVEVATVDGDINITQWNTDLLDDNKAVIGGGEWNIEELLDFMGDLNSQQTDIDVTINDGYFYAAGCLRIDKSNVVINGGIYDIDTYVATPRSDGLSSVVINGGEWRYEGEMTFADIGGGATAELLIKGGDFYWSGITGQSSLEIMGGKFRFDPTAYVDPAECTVIDRGNGTWEVVPNTNAALVNEEETTICSCETKCTEPNEACEVCKTDIVLCKGAEDTQPETVKEETTTPPAETQTPDGQNASESEETSEPVISTDPVILPSEDEAQESSDD